MSAQDTFFCKNKTLNCAGEILDLDTPAIMGILNVTPDSFYDGGKYKSEKEISTQVGKMISEGASIIDIGACSSRPGAKMVTEDDELSRLLPTLQMLKKEFPKIIFSVDTYRSSLAHAAAQEGAGMINDISGGLLDTNMFDTVGQLGLPYVLMHMQGNPATMQENPHYKDVVMEVKKYFTERIALASSKNIQQIIVDPGFGFGKTVEHNYELLRNLESFREFQLPILVGISRKSMVNNILKIKTEDALSGTIALNTIAIIKGANILRVHDVKEAVELVKICETFSPSIQKN